MILKNMYKALATAMLGYDYTPGVKCTDGSTRNASVSYSNYNMYTNVYGAINRCGTSKTTSGIVFGNGTTEPSPDDYILKGDYFSGVSGSVARSYTCDDAGVTYKAICTLTNGSSEDFTISEIGLQNGGSSTSMVLLERTLLDEPIAIPAGGIGVVTYTIRMNYPTT